MKMVSKIGDIECLLCNDLISFYDGETGIFQSHLELKHEVEVANKDLVIAFCFLREKELQEFVNKVQPRKEYFLEHGEEEIDDDNDEELVEELEQPTEQIKQMLSDGFTFELDEKLMSCEENDA